MIRDRLKKAARQAAVRLLNMEFDTEERDPRNRHAADPSAFDPAKIPKIVDGDGDTPGPNHKTEVGRPFLSAQIVAGVSECIIDTRAPGEVVGGMLPGAMLYPADLIKQHLDLLPTSPTERVILVDQTGEQGAEELSEWLRNKGYWARWLRGGMVEWIEQAEPMEPPPKVDGAKYSIGDPVRVKGKGEGEVMAVERTPDGERVRVWLASGEAYGPVDVDALDS